MNEFDFLFNMMFGGLDVIFWIMIIASVVVVLIKGIFWIGMLKSISSGLRSFTDPYGVDRPAPARQISRNDKLSLVLTVLGLIIGVVGLLK